MPDRIIPHSTNRLFEWAMATIMLKMGLGVFAAGIFGFKVTGAFTAFVALGLDLPSIGLLFSLLGAMRCVALYANGKWRNGCYVRALGCAVGVVVWVQMFGGILLVLIATDQLFMVLFVWSTFAAFEFFSLCRSILDLRAYGLIRVSENAARSS